MILFFKHEVEFTTNGIDFYEETAKFERDLILWALKVTKYNTALAAKKLAMNRTTLLERMKRLGVPLASQMRGRIQGTRGANAGHTARKGEAEGASRS